MSKIITANGHEVDFSAAVNLMDDEIRKDLHDKADGWTDQQFYEAETDTE